jgi:hydroxymethylglutaryl-CoA lyase
MTDPYSGPTSPQEVISVAQALLDMGCYEISLGDTTGEGDPGRWGGLWSVMKREGVDMEKFAVSQAIEIGSGEEGFG